MIRCVQNQSGFLYNVGSKGDSMSFSRLWLIGLLSVFLLWLQGCCSSDRYSTDNVGVGVSAMLNEFGELDLEKHLDASKLPSMIEECYKEGLQEKKKGEELQRYVVRALSQKLRQISTVDLNGDGTTDPILVVPEGDEEQMTYSIRVPNPEEVKELPKDVKDAGVWEDIAKNKSVELVAVTAVPRTAGQSVKSMEFEARPSSHFYSNPYYYRSSFTSDLLTYMIVRDLFFRPSWYGPSYYGWYGGYYRPYTVRHIHSNRTTTTKRYSSGKTSFGRLTTQSGKIPARSTSSKTASRKSFSASKSVRNNIKSGGFGRSSRGSSGRSAFGRSSSSKSSSRGWFSGRSSSGGSRWGK